MRWGVIWLLVLLVACFGATKAESHDQLAGLEAEARNLLKSRKSLKEVVSRWPAGAEKDFLMAIEQRQAKALAAYISAYPAGRFADIAEVHLVRLIADRPTETGVGLYNKLYPKGTYAKALQQDLERWQVKRAIARLQAARRNGPQFTDAARAMPGGPDAAFKRLYVCAVSAYEEEDYTRAARCLKGVNALLQ